MARIPEVELERLKREIDLAALVRAKGVELKPHGTNDLAGCCPFHEDKTPSFIVTPGKNLFHCLGCGAGGTVIDFLMKYDGLSFRHAVEVLRDGQAAKLMASSAPTKKTTVPKLAAPVAFDADDQTLMRQVVDYYHETLKRTPEALAYLQKRGIGTEAVDAFKLGFADRTLGIRLPQKNRKDGAAIRERLTKLGVYRESGHEHLNGSLVIPIISDQGEVTQLYGRKVCDHLRPGTAYHLYLPRPHRGLWNPACLSSSEVILCESLIDALTFWTHGFRNVTASYGVEGFTDDHLNAFIDHRVKKVWVAYDRDEAGDRGAAKHAPLIQGEGIDCYRVLFPPGMDANEYALKVSPAQKSLHLLLQSAAWMGTPKSAPVAVSRPLLASSASLAAKTLAAEPAVTPTVSVKPAIAAVVASAPKEEATKEKSVVNPSTTPTPAVTVSVVPPVAPVVVPPAPVVPSSSVPPSPAVPSVPLEMQGEDVVITFGDRQYRVRGLAKNHTGELLKVNVRVWWREKYHLDTLDFYRAKERQHFIEAASVETGLAVEVLKKDLGRVLLKLEEMQEERLRAALAPAEKEIVLKDDERQAALDLLKSPDLLSRIVADFAACGVVGEETNKLVGYLACVSRKLDRPLAVIIQSTSAAGKSSLMNAVLSLIPDEDVTQYSAMTGQSLYYLGESDLKHKILAIAEEEGAEKAAYALKLLQSEGELTIASTGKEPSTGRLVTQEYRVEGPVMIFLTTTAVDIDEELLNRCLILTVDEGREQTRAIHALQREQETLEGLLRKQARDRIQTLHRNAQRLLKPFLVANPFARHLTFLDDRTRTRRDHVKYLTLIRSIALLHQHQRPQRTTTVDGKSVAYIEVTREDIAAANRVAHEVLGRSLDELPPQTRRLLRLLDQMVTEACDARKLDRCDYHFSRREVRGFTGWGHTQLKIHLHRLEELEYVLVHRADRGQSFLYELLYAGGGDDGERFLPHLLDVEKLPETHGYDEKRSGLEAGWSGQNGGWSGVGRPLVGPRSGGGRGDADAVFTSENGTTNAVLPENVMHPGKNNGVVVVS